MDTKIAFLVSLVVLYLSIVSSQSSNQKPACEQFEKIGCFRDNYYDRTLPDQLIANTRDPTNPAYEPPILDWNNWRKSMKILACKCAKSARAGGYQHFGLQFYGECWAGHDEEDYKKLGSSPMSNCAGSGSSITTCNMANKKYCVGRNETNFVYRLKRTCHKVLDLAFVLDTSGSISARQHRRSLRFIKKLADEFEVGADKTHVAALHFSTQARTDFRFTNTNMYKRRKLFRAIKNIPKKLGRTHTKAALRQADKDFFCPSCGSRDIQKVLVVISDGKSNDRRPLRRKSFAQVTAPLRNKGVHIIAVGLGARADMNEMREIATKPKYAVKIRKYDVIENHLHSLATLICE